MDARSRQPKLGRVMRLPAAVALAASCLLAGRLFWMRPDAASLGVGDVVADFTLSDLQGQILRLSDLRRSKSAVVLLFSGIDCPVGNLYLPRFLAIEARYGPRNVAFVAINSNAHESVEQVAEHARNFGLSFPVLKDWHNALADRLRIDRIGEVLLIDSTGRLRYRGAVDDQYARGAFKDKPTRFYLDEALAAVLAGRPVREPITSVVTCPIDRVIPPRARRPMRGQDPAIARLRRRPSPEPIETRPITYAEHAASILRERCQTCHRPGEVAPFSLLSYGDAKRWSESIFEVVDQGLMPPWHADPRYGTFANDRSLSDQERAVMMAWVEQGALPGDLAKVPAPAESRLGWTIGTPDVVFEMPAAFDVPSEGQLPIEKFVVPTGFTHDVWVEAAQAMPGDRSVVHHICVFIIDPAIEPSGANDIESRRRERPELVCYAPGDMPCIFPPGVAKRIPAGAALEIQVHYQPVGAPRFDRSSVGLRLARGEIRCLAVTRGAANRDFVLPPGAANVELRSSYTLLEDGHLLSLTPHMHYRGRDFRYDAVYPDGHRETLLSVPHYDFNWQNVYRLAQPKPLPRGTRIECEAHFDNSAANPVNPDHTREVRWGEQSTDEMMIGYLDYCVDLPAPRMAAGRAGLIR